MIKTLLGNFEVSEVWWCSFQTLSSDFEYFGWVQFAETLVVSFEGVGGLVV